MDIWKLADDLGLTVRERRGTHRSGYAPDDNHIDLTPGMRGRVLRGVMCHEIGHHVLGHRPTEFGLVRKRQEFAANAWAAHTLITPEAYAEAEQHRGGHVTAMAIDLNVPDELVVVYQRTLLRTDQATYVRPRLGAAQFAHRVEVSA
jgi:hypothetical protein